MQDDEGITLKEENGPMTSAEKRRARYLRVLEQGGIITTISPASEEGQHLVEVFIKTKKKLEEEQFGLPHNNEEDGIEQTPAPEKKATTGFQKLRVF